MSSAQPTADRWQPARNEIVAAAAILLALAALAAFSIWGMTPPAPAAPSASPVTQTTPAPSPYTEGGETDE